MTKNKDGSKKKPKAGDALNKLLKYLLPIAGKRILLLLGLAFVRTAFSNRLARMQVNCVDLAAFQDANSHVYSKALPISQQGSTC